MSALDRELLVLRGFCSSRGDDDAVDEAEAELKQLRAELANLVHSEMEYLFEARKLRAELAVLRNAIQQTLDKQPCMATQVVEICEALRAALKDKGDAPL